MTEAKISHTTSDGNQISILIKWRFGLDGRWMPTITGTVDNKPCEYRGRSLEKDGTHYELVHVPGVAAYAVPREKWKVPPCPMSESWRAFVEFLEKPAPRDESLLEENYREKDRLIRAVMESDTMEGFAVNCCFKNIMTGSWNGTMPAAEFALGMNGPPMKTIVDWMSSKEMKRVRGLCSAESTRRREVVI